VYKNYQELLPFKYFEFECLLIKLYKYECCTITGIWKQGSAYFVSLQNLKEQVLLTFWFLFFYFIYLCVFLYNSVFPSFTLLETKTGSVKDGKTELYKNTHK
jgi:hypothetical protein